MTTSTVICARIQSDISKQFETRKGDALAWLVFNIAPDIVVRNASLNHRGTILYKSTQLLVYTDDVDLIS